MGELQKRIDTILFEAEHQRKQNFVPIEDELIKVVEEMRQEFPLNPENMRSDDWMIHLLKKQQEWFVKWLK